MTMLAHCPPRAWTSARRKDCSSVYRPATDRNAGYRGTASLANASVKPLRQATAESTSVSSRSKQMASMRPWSAARPSTGAG